MELYTFLAELSFDPNPNFLLPLAAGVAVGAGVVSAVHYFLRPRSARMQQAPGCDGADDPFYAGSASEQRGAFRRKGNAIGVLIEHPVVGGRQIEGVVMNRSLGGLC